jgi:sugar phosphate permease
MLSPASSRRWTDRFSNGIAARLPFFYGYVMIPVAMAVQIASSPGQTFAVSAFKPALLEALSLSHTQFSFAYMTGTMLAALPLSLVGPLADRFGLRVVISVVVVALAATCLFASTVTGIVSLLLTFWLLRFLGQGSMSLLSGNTLSMWFRHRIGRVSAVMSIGMAFAFALVPDLLIRSIDAYGWQTSYRLMAVVLLGVLLPLLGLLFRNRPEDLGQRVDGRSAPPTDADGRFVDEAVPERALTLRQAARHRTLWILAAGMFAWAMIGTAVVLDLVTLCTERGLSESNVAPLFRTFAISMLTMQLIGGVLADLLPLNRLLAVGMTMLASGVAVLAGAEQIGTVHLFAALFGGGQGLTVAVGAVIWVRYYGRQHLGKIRGTIWSLTVAGSGVGPLIMGLVRDADGRFDRAIQLFVVLLVPLAIASWWAHEPPEKPPEKPPGTPSPETLESA